MKKLVFGRKLSRDYGSRKALFRALIRAIVLSGAIKTTKAKAKAVQGKIDRTLRTAQGATLSSRRRVYSMMANDRQVTDKIFELAEQFKPVTSGFTRIVNLPARKGDLAEMVRLEWARTVQKPETKTEKPESKKKTDKKGEKPIKQSLDKKINKVKSTKSNKDK